VTEQPDYLLNNLFLDLNIFETTDPAPAPVIWGCKDSDEDIETTTERVYHFQAQGHAQLGAWMTRAYLGVPSNSLKIPPDGQIELAWEGLSRLLMGFTRSILVPDAEFELSTNAAITAIFSIKRIIPYIGSNKALLDQIRVRTALNTYTYVYSMMLMYRNHPTFSDKVASHRLEKIGVQAKRVIEASFLKDVTYDLLEQSTIISNASFNQLLQSTKRNK
jgi:hypothetical protein